jgi:hypothetical protein
LAPGLRGFAPSREIAPTDCFCASCAFLAATAGFARFLRPFPVLTIEFCLAPFRAGVSFATSSLARVVELVDTQVSEACA